MMIVLRPSSHLATSTSGCTVKSVSATLILIGTMFYIACNMDTHSLKMNAATSGQFVPSNDTWRRTAQGWEQTTDWQETEPIIPQEWLLLGSIHPALVASLQLLISLGALIAWNPSPSCATAKPH